MTLGQGHLSLTQPWTQRVAPAWGLAPARARGLGGRSSEGTVQGPGTQTTVAALGPEGM